MCFFYTIVPGAANYDPRVMVESQFCEFSLFYSMWMLTTSAWVGQLVSENRFAAADTI